MATLESLGLGSGVLTSDLVERLIQAERQSTDLRLDNRQELTEAKITAYGEIKSRMAAMQDAAIALSSPTLTSSTIASSSDETILTATTGLGAEPGVYNVEVVNTAKAHSIATASYSSMDEVVGKGKLTFSFGEIEYDGTGRMTGQKINANKAGGTIVVDESNNTLSGLRDAINRADIGINATIVNDGSGYRLQLTSSETGKENGIRIMAEGENGEVLSSGLGDLSFNEVVAGLVQTSKGEDAHLLVNGLSIYRASNNVDEVIRGVTLNLHNADVDKNITVRVSADLDELTSTLQSYVNSYNELKEFVDDLSKFDAVSQVGGLLMGDTSIRSMMESLRSMISQPIVGINGKYRSLTELGINTNKDNKYLLEFDTAQLAKAMDESRNDVIGLLSKGGRTSDGQIIYMNESVNTKPGDYDIVITQLATQAKYQGSSVAGLANNAPVIIDQNNNQFSINVNGINANIELLQGNYDSAEELAKHIAQQINGDSLLKERGHSISVAYNQAASRFDITSNLYGSASQISFTSVPTGTANTLGFTTQGGGANQGTELAALGAAAFANGGLALNAPAEFNISVDGTESTVPVSVAAGTYATPEDLEIAIESAITAMLNYPASGFSGIENPAQLSPGAANISELDAGLYSFGLVVNGHLEEVVVDLDPNDRLASIQNALDDKFTGDSRVLASLENDKLVLQTENTGIDQSLRIVSNGSGARTQAATNVLHEAIDFSSANASFDLIVGGVTLNIQLDEDATETGTLSSIQQALNLALEESGEFYSSDVLAQVDENGHLYFQARGKKLSSDPSVYGSTGTIEIANANADAQALLGIQDAVGLAGRDSFQLPGGSEVRGDNLQPQVTYQQNSDGSKGSLSITLGGLGKSIQLSDLNEEATAILGLRQGASASDQVARGKDVEGLIDGVKAVGEGQFLRAQTGTTAATNGYYLGNQAWDFSTPLTLTSSNNSFKLSIDGVEAEVTVAAGSYNSGEDLALALQKAIDENATFKAAEVTAKVEYTNDSNSYAHQKFSMISTSSGAASEVKVLEAGEAAAAVFGLVTGIGQGEVGRDKSGADSNAAGIRIRVLGGSLGERGTVSFVSGFGDQLRGLLSGFLNGSQSLIGNRENAFSLELQNISEARDRLNMRIEATEKRLKASFQYNDAIVARLNSTLDFVKMQFEAMANTGKK